MISNVEWVSLTVIGAQPIEIGASITTPFVRDESGSIFRILDASGERPRIRYPITKEEFEGGISSGNWTKIPEQQAKRAHVVIVISESLLRSLHLIPSILPNVSDGWQKSLSEPYVLTVYLPWVEARSWANNVATKIQDFVSKQLGVSHRQAEEALWNAIQLLTLGSEERTAAIVLLAVCLRHGTQDQQKRWARILPVVASEQNLTIDDLEIKVQNLSVDL